MKSDWTSALPNSSELLATVEELKHGLADGGDQLGQQEVTLRRQQLQTALQTLLLADLEFALDHKAEQELWTSCFKSQIALLQSRAKDKKLGIEQKEWQANLHLFLDSASGFYTMLLHQLCQTYDIDLPFRRKDALLTGFFDCEKEKRTEGTAMPNHSSCCYVVQDCLVHMGDIARYRGKVKLAESCYRHAVKLLPSSGQPYNQLALLEAQHGDGISAVYYYVRSVAVRQPFPAATTNLAKLYTRLAGSGEVPEVRPRLTASSYTALFLQLHARLQLRRPQQTLRQLQVALAVELPRLLFSNSLSTWRLLQMLAITVQAVHAAAGHPDGAGALEPATSTAGDPVQLEMPLEVVATTLDALLRASYRLQGTAARREWPALPAVRLYVSWLCEVPAALALDPLSTRPQLWAHLCHLVNGLEVSAEMLTQAAESRLPLPEDVDLAGFLPLSGCQRGLKLSRPPVPEPEQAAVRAARLRLACERLARHGVVWSSGPAGSLQSGYSVDQALVLRQLSQAEADSASVSPPPPVSPVSSVPSTPEGVPLDPSPPLPGRTVTAAARGDCKTGILKSETGPVGRRRQNVALQAIMKSGAARGSSTAEETRSKDARQVTFRTPSPTPVPSPPPVAPPQSQQQPPRNQQQQLPPRHMQQQLLQQQARAARAAGDTWRPSPASVPLASPPSGVWPPPRAPHPLEEQPVPGQSQGLQFNPLVPPPGWASGAAAPGQGWPGRAPPLQQEPRARPPVSPAAAAAAGGAGAAGAAPFDVLKQSLWSGWPMAAAAATAPVHRQPNPLAAILSQCRAPAPGMAQELARPRDSLGLYSLFPNAPAQEAQPRVAAYSLFPSSNMQQQSMWPSAGPSPLERLIEQQRQQSGHNKP